MSTNKPRIQAYVDAALHQQFEQERSQWGISQSQALERILSERYRSTDKAAQFKQEVRKDYDLSWIKISLGNIRERLTRLEITNNLDDDIAIKLDSEIPNDLPILSYLKSVSELELVTTELPSELDSELESVTDELPSELDSELQAVTTELPSELDSELQAVTDELPSELDSELQAVTTELPSELESVTDELPSELDSELESVTDELPSELDSELESVTDELPSELIITENIAVPLPENLSQALSESPIELSKIVICAINKKTNLFYFWNGSQKGFTNSMVNAKRYKSEGMAERARLGILKDDYFSDYYSGNFELRYNTVRYFREHPSFQPKGKILASV